MADVPRLHARSSHEEDSSHGDATEESLMKFDISGNPSYGDLTIALAARRPSACEPDENLWPEAPQMSPHMKRPFTVDWRL